MTPDIQHGATMKRSKKKTWKRWAVFNPSRVPFGVFARTKRDAWIGAALACLGPNTLTADHWIAGAVERGWKCERVTITLTIDGEKR